MKGSGEKTAIGSSAAGTGAGGGTSTSSLPSWSAGSKTNNNQDDQNDSDKYPKVATMVMGASQAIRRTQAQTAARNLSHSRDEEGGHNEFGVHGHAEPGYQKPPGMVLRRLRALSTLQLLLLIFGTVVGLLFVLDSTGFRNTCKMDQSPIFDVSLKSEHNDEGGRESLAEPRAESPSSKNVQVPQEQSQSSWSIPSNPRTPEDFNTGSQPAMPNPPAPPTLLQGAPGTAEENALLLRNRQIALDLIEKYGPTHSLPLMNMCRAFFGEMSFTSTKDKSKFTSQCSQDFWLFNYVFAPLLANNLIERTYIDVGTHHYKMISNMYPYDVCLGFRGVCGEPKSENHADIRAHRRCELIDTCVSDREEVMEFIFHGGESGLASEHQVELKNPGHAVHTQLTCRTLQPSLDKMNISYVSFMSLDVEGGEFKVLGGVDFSKTTIGVILWEIPRERVNMQRVIDYAASLGYKRLALPDGSSPISSDYIFIHHSFPLQPEQIMASVEYKCRCSGCSRI